MALGVVPCSIFVMETTCLMVGADQDVPLSGAVIVVSDRCASGIEKDTSGAVLREALLACGVECGFPVVVPDEVPAIRGALIEALELGARLIFTTGGTGVGPRDVTPEATAPLVSKHLPGLAQLLISASLEQTVAAALSRGLVGLSEGPSPALIVNAPGSSRGAACYVETVLPLLSHLFAQLDTVPTGDERYGAHDV